MKLKSDRKFQLVEKLKAKGAKEGPVVSCVLITAGLGNRHDLNYYSPEALVKGVTLFEGRPCYLDHMSESESSDLPERSVKAKCGYFKNVRSESISGETALVGELHFDLSESGQMAYQKALTAIHYKGEFPNSESEYVGLSINANGKREKRRVQVDGELLEVNYVTEFTDVGSIDEVTTPARGGRFLAALVESAAGAIMQRKGKQTMLVKSLKAAQSALKEALKDENLSEETKKHLSESDSSIDSLLKEAMKAAKEQEAKLEESDDDAEVEVEESETELAEAKKKESKKAKEDMDGEESDDKEKDDDKDVQESKRGYIKALLKEAGIPKKVWNIDRLMKLSLKEAKADIAEKKALLESVKEASTEEQEFVPVGSVGGEPLEESERSANLNGMFAGLAE